jgi:hypothetical protein
MGTPNTSVTFLMSYDWRGVKRLDWLVCHACLAVSRIG